MIIFFIVGEVVVTLNQKLKYFYHNTCNVELERAIHQAYSESYSMKLLVINVWLEKSFITYII